MKMKLEMERDGISKMKIKIERWREVAVVWHVGLIVGELRGRWVKRIGLRGEKS